MPSRFPTSRKSSASRAIGDLRLTVVAALVLAVIAAAVGTLIRAPSRKPVAHDVRLAAPQLVDARSAREPGQPDADVPSPQSDGPAQLAASLTLPAADTHGADGTRGSSPLATYRTASVESQWAARAAAGSTSRPAGTTASSSGQAPYDRSARSRQERVQRFGGNAATEDAVEAGLTWLAAHQSPDGSWDRHEFNRHCPPGDRCTGIATSRDDQFLTSGLTGLSLLAFLGAGYTHDRGPFQDVVRKGVDALLAFQQRDGGFSRDDGMAGYNDALATFALAEYAAMTRDPQVERPLRAAVDRLTLSQQDLGGWDYPPDPRSGRNDTSITAWVVQALHACEAAGVSVPRAVLVKAASHFARAALPDGRVWYADAGTGFAIDRTTLQPQYRYGAAMSACALTCESLLGWRLDSPTPSAQAARLLAELPSAARARGRDPTGLHSEYYWYYGTVAMFQVGGDSWERWNATLRDMILPMQERGRSRSGEPRHAFGSWPPYGENWGKWGRMGGRVYSTAIAVLTLEIYYRATPAYLGGEPALDGDDWRAYLAGADPRRRLRAVRALREARLEIGEAVLIDALSDPDPAVALQAATSLAALDSPMGRTLMERVVDNLPPWERGPVERALERLRELDALAPATGRVRVFDADLGLATLELTRAYVGQEFDLLRPTPGESRAAAPSPRAAASQPVGRLRVIQRITGQNIAVGRWLGDGSASPAAGDTLVESR